MLQEKLSLIVVAHKFAWTTKDIVDGLTHRYCGLYANLCKLVLRYGGSAFWYSAKDRVLLKLPEKAKVLKCGIFRSLLTVTSDNISRGVFTVIILDYPHSFLGVKHLLDYLASLLLLHLIRLLNRGFIVVDNMDPPIEHAIELSGKVTLLQYILWSFLNRLVYSFDLVVYHSQSYRVYHKLYYGINYDRSIVIPPGSFPEMMSYEEPPQEESIRVICSGSVSKWVGINNLLKIVKMLNRNNVRAEFVVIDRAFPKDINIGGIKVIRHYMGYRTFLDTLKRSHILLLLRPKSLHHLLTVRASLPDYLVVGRPILYPKSLGSRELVQDAGCCYEFDKIEDITKLIPVLADDKALLKNISLTARLFAEKHMVYMERAKKLLVEILSRLSHTSKCGL